MKQLRRLRTWARLIAATMLALIALGWAFKDRETYGYWRLGPEPTTLYIDPRLAEAGYEYWGTKNWIASDFSLYQLPPSDWSDWADVKEIESPGWVMDAVQAGYDSASRTDFGWPLRFARSEFAYEPADFSNTDETTPFISVGPSLVKQSGFDWIGPVPYANHPLFPGFLLLVAAVYGLLLALEQALWIPARMRTRRRRKRGYCERCGYDLSGVAIGVCPECGVTRA